MFDWLPDPDQGMYDMMTYRGLIKNDVGNLYPQTPPPDAQPEVKHAVARFKALSDWERSEEPMLYWLLGSGTQPYKMSRPDSQYIFPTPIPTHTCDLCVYAFQNAVTKKFICSQIRGHIHPKAWCRLWEGK